MNKIILKKNIDNCCWDYRIIQKDNSFAIHEVEFFNNEVVGWTNQPDVIAGDLEDLRGEVEAMMEAFIKPVLKYNEINKPPINKVFGERADEFLQASKESRQIKTIIPYRNNVGI